MTVHPLVAEVVLDDLPGPVARDRLESAAVRLLRQAADRRDPGHPGDPWVANLTGRHDAAALAFRTLYADQERALGPTHPHTLRTRGGLVRALLFGGEPDSAADLAATLRAEQQAVLGRAHPDILHTRASQALADATAGRSERAEEALGELIVEQEALLGVRASLLSDQSRAPRLGAAVPGPHSRGPAALAQAGTGLYHDLRHRPSTGSTRTSQADQTLDRAAAAAARVRSAGPMSRVAFASGHAIRSRAVRMVFCPTCAREGHR